MIPIPQEIDGILLRGVLSGNQSARGSRFVETVPNVIETCPGPARHSLDDLTAAPQAHLAGQPRPSLLTRV